jgi:hypothetical protein
MDIRMTGIVESGGEWLVSFECIVDGNVMWSAYIPVPKNVEDDKIIAIGKHILNELMKKSHEQTRPWNIRQRPPVADNAAE